jgi:hypothetical protein
MYLTAKTIIAHPMDCCNVDGVTANLNGPSASGKGRKQGQGAAGQDGLDSSSGQAAEAVQPAIQAMAAALGVDVATSSRWSPVISATSSESLRCRMRFPRMRFRRCAPHSAISQNMFQSRVARFFLVRDIKTGKMYQINTKLVIKNRKIFQMAIKCINILKFKALKDKPK